MLAEVSKLGVALALGVAMLTGCDDDGVDLDPPSTDEVAAEYVAADEVGLLTSEDDEGSVTDLLEDGATLTLTLGDDGTTAGELTIPEGGTDGQDLVADLEGTWTLDGFAVTLHNESGTFLEGLELMWTDGVLAASGNLTDTTTFELQLELDPA